jgi:hypothetical protein
MTGELVNLMGFNPEVLRNQGILVVDDTGTYLVNPKGITGPPPPPPRVSKPSPTKSYSMADWLKKNPPGWQK